MALKNILPTQDPDRGQFSVWGLKDGVFLVGIGSALGQADSNNSIKFKSLAISSDNEAAIGIKQDGTLWAWGTKAAIAKTSRWVDIKAGQDHIAALDIDGGLFVAGSDEYGQLGLNNARASLNVANVVTGAQATFIIRTDNTVLAWGGNAQGATGLNKAVAVSDTSAEQLQGSWVSIATGGRHSLGVKSDGTLWAWGNNAVGQLGFFDINTWTAASKPNAGEFFHLIRSDGALYGVGRNTYGQLGTLSTLDVTTPDLVSNGSWTAVGSAYRGTGTGISPLTVALAANGDLYQWGRIATGEGVNVYRSSPVFLAANVTSFDLYGSPDLGENAFKLTYISNGDLYVAGNNAHGALGVYNNSGNVYVLTAGKNILFFGKNDDNNQSYSNNFYASGLDTHGEFYNGITNHSETYGLNSDAYWQLQQTTFVGDETKQSLNGTTYYELADGFYPRGNNLYGQHGLGTLDGQWLNSFINVGDASKYSTTAPPSGFNEAIANSFFLNQIAPGYNGTLMTTDFFELYGWGRNEYGAFNNSINTESWTAISTGFGISLGLTSTGRVLSWITYSSSANSFAKEITLGRSEGDMYPHPVLHSNGDALSATLISTSGGHSLVLGTDGNIYSWGFNSSGQLGLGSSGLSVPHRSRPTQISSQPSGTVTLVHAGANTTSFCVANNKLYYWGSAEQYFDTPPSYYGGYYGYGDGGY